MKAFVLALFWAVSVGQVAAFALSASRLQFDEIRDPFGTLLRVQVMPVSSAVQNRQCLLDGGPFAVCRLHERHDSPNEQSDANGHKNSECKRGGIKLRCRSITFGHAPQLQIARTPSRYWSTGTVQGSANA